MLNKFLFGMIFAFCSVQSEEFAIKVTEDEGKAISEIVTTLGKSSLVALGFKKSHLKSLGQGLKGIGSLHFLGYILNSEELKMHMKAIRKSSFKWDGFMDGLKPGFESALKSNKLLISAQEHNWDEFVAILVENEVKK